MTANSGHRIFPEVNVDDMVVALDPTYDSEGAEVNGEHGLIWSDAEDLPWNCDVSTTILPYGFRATINNPYHETRTMRLDDKEYPLFSPLNTTSRVTFERSGGFSAEERHIMLAGITRAYMQVAQLALQVRDAQEATNLA